MAKQQPNIKPHLPSTGNLPSVADLPSVGAMTEGDVPVVKDTPVQLPFDRPEVDSAGMTTGVIEVPVATWLHVGFVRRRVNLNLNREQAEKLKAIQLGLEMREARLIDGRVVNDSCDVIRWMLENLVS